MKADLSRDSFRRQHRYTRVLMQQGRVLLDADWNEQAAILFEMTRTLAADLIGPHGGPGDGFKITASDDLPCDFEIGRGRYYVEGIACELTPLSDDPGQDEPVPIRYTTQSDFPVVSGDCDELRPGGRYLVYLDVWERHINRLQDDAIHDPALGGSDTATRAKIICQVKAAPIQKADEIDLGCEELLNVLVRDPMNLPRRLRARARIEVPVKETGSDSSTRQYRGSENRLYRIEIHDAGTAGAAAGKATFKWSRDNGSVAFKIRSLQGATVTLDSLGADAQHDLKEGDWVEIVDNVSELTARPRPLRAITSVDRANTQVTLDVPEGEALPDSPEDADTHPILRRWDQGCGAIPVQEKTWIELEDGIQVWFEDEGDYKTGDYWQIPAREAIADILWPQEKSPGEAPVPKAQRPQGIRHYFAPLRRIYLDEEGHVTCVGDDCRRVFPTLTE